MIKFKQITAIAASALIAGLTMGTAVAANYPAPFVTNGVANVAVVYGTGAGVSQLDQQGATTIQLNLEAAATSNNAGSTVVAGDIKVTDKEVALGAAIGGDDIPSTIKENKLSSLFKGKITWDDGSGSDDYSVHEELAVAGMDIRTTNDDEKLKGVAMTNQAGLEYKYIFEDALNTSAVGTSDADTLYLNLLGKDYEIQSMTASSITVTTSQEVSMAIGQEYTINGKKVVLEDVYEGSVLVSVDGKEQSIDADKTARINGIRVNVKTIGYHSNTPETSKAILKIGEDISKTYTDGDEFIGQDKDDPLWVWDISSLGSANGYIGVKYNANINSANDEIAGDTIKYVGEGYVFPNNYAAVTLDSITDAKYHKLALSFDEADLFNNSDTSTAFVESGKVLVIKGDATDAITAAGHETDTIYVYWNTTLDSAQTYYRDFDGDYTPTNKYRLANASAANKTADGNDYSVASKTIATVNYGETDLKINITATSDGKARLLVYNTETDFADNLIANVSLGGTAITNTTGTFEQFGANDADAEAGDVIFNGTDVSTKDYSFMDHYGIKVSDGTTVKDEADNDELTLSVPEEQVFAQVSVSMGATVEEPTQLGVVLAKDSESDKLVGKNLIVVGGSCINSIAAKLLGSNTPVCGNAFSAITKIGAGQAIIKAYSYEGKTALLVAGYDAADTSAAVAYLTNQKPDTSRAWTVTSATQATVLAN